jgi:hypothetical protein
MKKSGKLLQLQALPSKQWIALEGADLAKSRRGCHAIRMNISIPCGDNPNVDEFLLAEKVRKLAKGLKAENEKESLRMIALMRLGFTVPAGMPTVWEMVILGDVPRAVSKKDAHRSRASGRSRPRPGTIGPVGTQFRDGDVRPADARRSEPSLRTK